MNLANTQTLPAKMYQFVTTLLYRRNVKEYLQASEYNLSVYHVTLLNLTAQNQGHRDV